MKEKTKNKITFSPYLHLEIYGIIPIVILWTALLIGIYLKL